MSSIGIMDGKISGLMVSRRPQGVNDHRHEAQHPARTLEFQQGGPVVVQPVENFGMDGIGGLDAFFVVRLAAFGRKFAALASVQVRKGLRRYVAQCERIGAAQRFEQAPAHDFEAFLGACRAPCRLEAADDVTEPVQRFAAPHACPPRRRRLPHGASCRYPKRGGI